MGRIPNIRLIDCQLLISYLLVQCEEKNRYPVKISGKPDIRPADTDFDIWISGVENKDACTIEIFGSVKKYIFFFGVTIIDYLLHGCMKSAKKPSTRIYTDLST